ncbi:Eisosome component PIL1-domain-containing protein [Aspergillus unguis]
MNRSFSGRRRSSNAGGRHRFSIGSFRGLQQPQLSKKMNRVIKSENSAISAHESAARQRISIAAQISEWGETTEDDAISDISDKMGVLLAEMGEQEDVYAQQLEEYRSVLKHIRDTEGSVQPTRDQRQKISDEIQRLKLKEPNSNKIETMEQELVRAEAQNLVAEAQLTNVTRQRFKEAYSVHLAAVIERGEKQALLARHARRLLNCLDDTSVIPGDEPEVYDRGDEAKQIVEDAEKSLHAWEGDFEPVETRAHITAGAVPASTSQQSSAPEALATGVPTTGALATEAPATRDLATEAPATGMPVTGALATEAPATGVSATGMSETGTFATEAPATRDLSTEAPAAGVPATGAPVTEAPAAESPVMGYPERQQDEFQGAEDSISDTYSHISANDAGSPTRVHGMSAPGMDASAFEGAPAAGGVGMKKDNVVNGIDARHMVSGPNPAEVPNSSAADADYAIRTKKRDSGIAGKLGAQALERIAVPI